VVPIALPPLRERKEDIFHLAEHFLYKYNRIAKKEITTISPEIKKALLEYDWPGNIRELENTIERAVVLSRGNSIEADSLMYHGISAGSSYDSLSGGTSRALDEVEKEYIKAVLQSQNENRSKAAAILKIDRKTLLAKIKKYGL
jgi:transcriptional regulator with PAS, ATPase and Fis domain